MSTPASGLSIAQQMAQDGSLPDMPSPQPASAQPQPESLARQMAEDGTLPDMPASPVPMRAVVSAAATTNPDAEAKTQQLARQAGMGVDLTRANPQAAQQRAVNLDLERRRIEFTNPVLARQLSDPNFAALAHDDLDALSQIGAGAATMRALTPMQGFESFYLHPAFQKLMQFPLTRLAVDAVGGTSGMAGNIGSFFGWHGGGPTKQNLLQRVESDLSPASADLYVGGKPDTGNDLDALVRNVAPMIPAMVASGGTSAIADALPGLGANAAKVLTALGVGGLFSASQGGAAYTETAAAGKSSAEARHAADLTAGLNLVPNVAMGLTDFLPALERNPLLAAAGVGGAAGATGQFAQNVVTGQPWLKGVAKGALQGAAVQGGMHLGLGFMDGLQSTTDAVAQSKLRARSPEAFQSNLNAEFEGDPALRIPAQDFVNYFHGKNLDPAAMAHQVGVSNLDEAALAGSDLEIPRENFFGKLEPEHQQGLLPDVVDPSTDLTARQTEEGKQELQQWMDDGGIEKLRSEYEQADAETQATPEWKNVYEDLKQRYLDAGENDTAAEGYATLQANAISNLARKAGLKPDELLAMHNPDIKVGEAPAEASTRYQDAIDKIRSVVQSAKGPGHAPQKAVVASVDPWLVSSARDNGVDIDGYRHVVDGSALRHVLNRHSDEQVEKTRGQLPVSEADFDRIPEILDAPDAVVFGTKTKGKRDQIGYIKRMADGSSLYLEEVRTGKRELAALSMRKYAAAKDFDSIAGTLPSNARSDGGSTVKIIRRPEGDADVGKHGPALYQSAPDAGEPLYQSGSDRRKARNMELARIQGEMLKGAPDGAETLGHPDSELHEVLRGMEDNTYQNRRKAIREKYGLHNAEASRILDAYDEKYPEGWNYSAEGRISEPEPESAAAVPEAGEKLGWFRMLGDGRYEIGKTKIGDLSTFIHEPAHAYLEMFRQLTQRGEVSDALQSDFKKITDWLGTTPEEAHANGFTREQHEQWARANEAYVRDGKAPSSGLQRAFHHFSVWLSSIYDRATRLGVELSPEIRGVMDRLYAGEEAVNHASQEAAKPLFETPEEAGWTEAEYRNYAEANDLSIDQAREQVRKEIQQAAERERTEKFREEKSNVRDAVTQEIDARPEYTAIRSLRRGSLDDGTPIALNRESLVNQFGEERVKALQQLHRGLYRHEGGTDADTAAEIFGYPSGEQMLQALEAAPRRARAIEAATRDYLVQKYGDVRYDGTLIDRARFAIENHERAGNIYRELRALKQKLARSEQKAADSKAAMASIALEPLEHYQEAARQMVQEKAPADLQPSRYLNASRKYSREAFDALRRGSVRAAADAKNKELLNHFLFREATAEREWVGKFEKYSQMVSRRTTQQKLGLAGSDYRDQFNWLLARYKLGSPMNPPERSLRDWADDMYDQGYEPAIDHGILETDRSRFADYRSVPMRELHALHDALVNVRALAMLEFKMYVQGKQVDFADARAAMVRSARENLKENPVPVLEKEPGYMDLVRRIQGVAVGSTRLEFLINKLDGGTRGPWHDNLWNLYENAKGDEFAMQHDFTKAVNDHVEAETNRQGLKLLDKVSVEGIPESETVTRKDLVSMALNMGNEGNLDRMRKSFLFHGWDPAAIERIGGMLTREEWHFVQNIWDSLKPYGERMAELEKRLTGLPPVMVKVKPFKVALDDGTEMDLGGGYYPIKIDPNYSLKGYDEDAGKSARNLMEQGYGRATTSRGYTKERTGFGGPLLFDYQRVLSEHIAKVTKDISHREFMLAANKLLTDTEVRQTLRETLGPVYEKQFMPWLRATVNDRNGSLGGADQDIRPLVEKLRSNLINASLGFKASTSLLQLTHLPRIMLFTRPGSFMQAMVDFWKDPAATTQTVRDLSPNEMRFRGENIDRDYHTALEEVSQKKGLGPGFVRFGLASLKYADHAISFPLWLSVYRDAMVNHAELPEAQAHALAVHDADAAVRMGIGTGTTGDLPPVMRRSDFGSRLETMLYGFHNLNFNILRHKVGFEAATDFRGGDVAGGAKKLTAGMALAWLIPAIAGSMVSGNGPKDGENIGEWAAKRSLFFAGGTLPILKDLFSLAEFGDMNPMISLAKRGVQTVTSATSDKPDKDWTGLGINALQLGGDAVGVPGTNQAAHTAKYLHRASEGKVQNPNAWNAIVGGGYK